MPEAIGRQRHVTVRLPGRILTTGRWREGHPHSIPDADDKLREITAYRLDRLEAEVLAPARDLAGGEARLRRMVTTYVRLALTDPGIMTLLSGEEAKTGDGRSPATQRRAGRFIKALEDDLAEIIRAQHRAPSIDSEVAAQSLLGIIHWGVCSHRAEERLSLDEAAAQITFLALHGLVAQPPGSSGRPPARSRRWNAA